MTSSPPFEPPSPADIRAAAERIAAVVKPTPLLPARDLSRQTGARIFLKAENLNFTGSFKIRGASNFLARLRDTDAAEAGVVAYSSGNHAQAVAAAAQLHAVPATIVMPADAPRIKLDATRARGAEVVTYDRYTEDRAAIAAAIAADRGAALVPPYDHPWTIAGQGTTGLEIAAQVPGGEIDVVLVCCGGGGLTAGMLTVNADVTEAQAMIDAVAAAEHDLGPLRVAVNAAGIANANPAEQMDRAQWQTMLDINLTGLFLSCQAEGNAMLAHGQGGAIVNIASMSGVIVNRGLQQVHYNTSKAGVIHLTKSLAMEWVDRGIRVNSISPGYTATPMNTRPEMVHQTKLFEEQTPMGRMAHVDEMVGPAVFLASRASSYCTGVDLLVDGGFCCW